MRRLALFVGLTVFAAWLADATCAAAAGGAGQESTIPHWGCVDNQCVEIYECGIDDCSACPGCNPHDEFQCLINGGTWDPSTCTCTPRRCNPWDEQEWEQEA